MIDKTPEGSRHDAAIPSGEVFREYGIVDLYTSFPAERYRWTPEMSNTKQEHVIVPFRVVKRGFQRRRSAELEKQRMEDNNEGKFTVVLLSDTRGL